MRVQLSPDARLDLEELEAFSRERWGRPRTRLYMAELRANVKTLRRDCELGAPRPDVNATARCLRSGRHLIFYTIGGGRVLVMRVLHDAMDAPRHVLP